MAYAQLASKDDKLDSEAIHLLTSHEYRDTPLTDNGVEQLKSTALECCHSLEFDTVLVSPLRRTVQTAVHLFEDHPQRD